MGTALTEPQLHLLSRYASRLILALDPDTAGQMATERGREVIERVSKTAAQQAGKEGVWDFDAAEREYRARLTAEFNARGMISYESRLGFDIRVVTLPEGQDPDDLIRGDPQAWAMLIEQALPIVEYVIRRTIEGQNLDDPKVKSEVARQIVPLIDGIADRVERDHYRQRLARLLKVTESALFAHSAPSARRSGTQRQRQQPVSPPPAEAQLALLTAPTRSREAFCLAALIHHPRLIYRVDRVLAEHLAAGYRELEGEAHGVLAWHFLPVDFVQPEHRAVFEAWRYALEQDELDPVACLREMLDPVSQELVDRWLALPLYALTSGGMPRGGDFTADDVYETALDGLLSLRKERINEQIEELRFLLEEAENGGSRLTVQEYESTLNALLVARRCIDLARQRAVRT
jgi:DNA primase